MTISNHLEDGSERPIMTADTYALALRHRGFPWLIEDVITCQSDLAGAALYEIWCRREDFFDFVLVYSRQGPPPIVGGYLNRIARSLGEAVSWIDSYGTGAGNGGGYTEAAVPEAWGRPITRFGLTDKQRRIAGGAT